MRVESVGKGIYHAHPSPLVPRICALNFAVPLAVSPTRRRLLPMHPTTSPSTRYRCGYPGCTKRYASTDGVRKHARKTHTAWLKSVDEASLTRDRETESKPSTYCVMEVDDQKTFDGHNPSMQLMQCRDLYDESMPAHLRQASFAAATAISLSLHSGSSLLHPRMSHHPSILGCGLTPVNTSRQTLQRDFPQTESLARMSSGCPPDCCCSRPWSSESAPPPRMLPPPPELSQEFNHRMPQTEVMPQKRPSPTFELDDPLCLTPPFAPSTLGNDNKCLSPFELEEKRPSKLARVGNVPLKPEPVRFPGEPLSYASGDAFCDRDAPSVMPVNEADYFDFFEALLAM